MFDNPTDNHTDIEVPLYYELRFTKLKKCQKSQASWYLTIIMREQDTIGKPKKTELI